MAGPKSIVQPGYQLTNNQTNSSNTSKNNDLLCITCRVFDLYPRLWLNAAQHDEKHLFYQLHTIRVLISVKPQHIWFDEMLSKILKNTRVKCGRILLLLTWIATLKEVIE